MENNIFKQIETEAINFTRTAKGTIQVQQTQRNKIKAQIEDELFSLLKTYLPDTVSIEKVKDGIALGVLNEKSDVIIPIVVDTTIKSLDYDIDNEVEDYRITQENKKIKAEKAAIAKAKKIESDAILRERLSRKEN